MKRLIKGFLLISVLALLSSCLPGDGKATAEEPANLLWGIWHGWVAPVSLFFSIFREHLTIYESFNTGFWYDLGFYMGVLGGFGSLSLSRKSHREKI
ncbi:MAG: hypothetical protein PQJ59_09980 [Spirochaetales bacterium]|nr:hypothetical protein [Spirochaetales bacterium]